MTPVPKIKPNKILKTLKDVSKIAYTSDYSKLFELSFLDLIQKNISANLSETQYGRKKGIALEQHDISNQKVPVVLGSYDWSSVVDKLDPATVAVKCINIGIWGCS